jgi:putative (di)nucleoside polyphosphate hydrolase
MALFFQRDELRCCSQHMTDSIDAHGFRANVGIVLIRDDRQVFLGGRTGGRGWQFPQGGVRQGESPDEALYRELTEEIGLERSDVQVLASTRNWLRYRLPRQYVRRNSHPPCIGQKQRWYLLRFVGSEDRFKFDSTTEPEFEAWRWVEYWTPVREVIFFKRAVYARALDELARQAFPNDPPALPDWVEEEKNLRNLARRRQAAAGA